MGKFGVGVGEEFPVDEKAKREDDGPSCCDGMPNGGGSREERREAWRRWRDQTRAEWRSRKRTMREQFHHEFADKAARHHGRHPMAGKLAVAGLALVGLAALFGHRHHDR